MNSLPTTEFWSRYRIGATSSYVAVVACLLFLAGYSLSDIHQRRLDLKATAEILAQLETRNVASGRQQPLAGAGPAGSPFLEGETVTVGGAALLQRVGTAAQRAGATVLSSQVDLAGKQSKDGFISVTVSFEINEPQLQALLYDLESGMPFLFVEQLNIQAQQNTKGDESSRLRVLLGISGQWRAKK